MDSKFLTRLEILRFKNQNSSWTNKDLYNTFMYKKELYILAYENIKNNPGNMTPGIDGKTLDGTSLQMIEDIIHQMRTQESFQFQRARKISIPKSNGGSRSLGIASPRDKIVQEAIRIILESIYDSPHGSSLSPVSFGFRKGMSAHNALQHIKQNWSGTTWFIEGDIKGCFDHIDHHILIGILKERIQDERFIRLIWKALRAGYLEFYTPVNNLAGTPQGSIISPILANIYLHKLDNFIETLKEKYDHQVEKKSYTPEYGATHNAIKRLRRKLDKTTDAEQKTIISKEIHGLKVKATTLKVYENDSMDTRIKYVRYADDFLISVSGTKAIADSIREEIKLFLEERLKLQLNLEKTHIRHAKTEESFFLGVRVSCGSDNPRVRTIIRQDPGKSTPTYVTRRTTSGLMHLRCPIEKIVGRLSEKEFCDHQGNPTSKKEWTILDDIQIVNTYSAVLNGYLNYYSFASNRSAMNRIVYILQHSAAKTLAFKHRKSLKHIFTQYGSHLEIIKTDSEGTKKYASLRIPDTLAAKTNRFMTAMERNALEEMKLFTNKLTRTNLAKACSLCGSEKRIEMHHIHHVRKQKEKRMKRTFAQAQGLHERKQIPVCSECHRKIHSGTYDGTRLMQQTSSDAEDIAEEKKRSSA